MVGKTTVSSSGTSRRDVMACGFTFCWYLLSVRVPRREAPAQEIYATRTQMLSGRHAQGAVEADDLAVEHRVGDDVQRERRVLVRAAEARRVRDRGAERGLGLLRQARHQRCVEQARGDGAHPDAVLGEIARGWKREADDAALGGRVGD